MNAPTPPRAKGRGRRQLLTRLVMALAAIGLFLIAYQWGNQYRYGSGEPPTIGGVLLRPPQPLPDFTLVGSRGEQIHRGGLSDHWTLVAVAGLGGAPGHRAIARQVDVYNRLGDQRDLRDQLRLWLVSSDSAPTQARDFERLSPAISILGGTPSEVEAFAQGLGAGPTDSDQALEALGDQTDRAATLDPPPSLFLLDPEARLSAVFPGAQPAAGVADDLKALARYHAVHGRAIHDGEREESDSGEE